MLAAMAMLLVLPFIAEAAETKTVRLMVSPSGSGPYNAFATIQTHMAEFSDFLRFNTEETPGFNFNVKYMASHPERYTDTIFGTGSVLNWAAKTGQKPFYTEPLKAMADFRAVVVLGPTFNTWVSTDSAIRTPNDFVGKRVGIGLLTQNEWGMHQRMLLDAWGLTPKLKSLDTLGPGQNISALLDGRTDVGTLFGLTSADRSVTVVTGPHRKLEASNRDWHYVNVPPEMIKSSGMPFSVVEYPPNTLPNQPEKVTLFGDLLMLSAHKSMPDDIVYEFVRVFVENADKIQAYHGFLKPLKAGTLAHTAGDNPDLFHPGSLKAFRDLGLLK
jgi:TRAP transporter TAXI family solute receptor